jgi:hypothetical protein
MLAARPSPDRIAALTTISPTARPTTRSALSIVRPRSTLMPTDMKKSPSRSPRNG